MKNDVYFLLALLPSVALFGCSGSSTPLATIPPTNVAVTNTPMRPTVTSAPATNNPTAEAPKTAVTPQPTMTVTPKLVNDPKNCTYIIEGVKITLKDGSAETASAPGAASKTRTNYFGNEASGDFNQDGIADIALILTQNPGGSGTFYYGVVALGSNVGCNGTNAVLLGDRIAPQSTTFQNGELIFNYADRKPNEPMTVKPSVGVSKYAKVNADKLIEVQKTASATPNATPQNVIVANYVCNEGKSFRVEFSKDQVNLTMNGKTYLLKQQISGSGFRYGNADMLMVGKGDSALLEDAKGAPLASNCNANTKPIATTTAQTLTGSAWRLVESSKDGKSAPNVESTLTFDAKNASGKGGCNRFSGSYTVTGDKIQFGAFASTLMACIENEVATQEAWYLKSLGTANRYEVSGNTLRIYFEAGKQVLTFAKK